MTFTEFLTHLCVYHAVHIIGVVGLITILEIDRMFYSKYRIKKGLKWNSVEH